MVPGLKKSFPVFIVLLCLLPMAAGAQQSVTPLLTYNTPPPFNPEFEHSLSHLIADRLNQLAQGQYQFQAAYLPRKRLMHHIDTDHWQGAVIWANPKWFNDEARNRYLWSEPLLTDTNLVLSHGQSPVDFQSPASLSGLRLGGILGYRYQEFEELIASGNIIRDDVVTDAQNLKRLKAGRIDVTFVSALALAELMRNEADADWQWLHISPTPRNTFDYAIFCDSSNTELMALINRAMPDLRALIRSSTAARITQQIPPEHTP